MRCMRRHNGVGACVEMSHTRLEEAARHYARAHQLFPAFHAPFFSLVRRQARLLICEAKPRLAR